MNADVEALRRAIGRAGYASADIRIRQLKGKAPRVLPGGDVDVAGSTHRCGVSSWEHGQMLEGDIIQDVDGSVYFLRQSCRDSSRSFTLHLIDAATYIAEHDREAAGRFVMRFDGAAKRVVFTEEEQQS